MISRFRKEEPALWSMLTQGKVTTPDDSTVIWNPLKQEGSEFFITTLNREDKKGKIISALQDITGISCSFTAASVSVPASDGQDRSDEVYIDNLYRTFGKEPVDVVDTL